MRVASGSHHLGHRILRVVELILLGGCSYTIAVIPKLRTQPSYIPESVATRSAFAINKLARSSYK